MKIVLLIVLLIVLFLGLTGCMSVSEQPEFEVVMAKEGDGVVTAVSGNIAIFDITSQSGIGSAKVTLASGIWPETILFRLHLLGLEEFKFAYGDTVITTSVSSSGDHLVLESVMEDSGERPLAEASAFYMPVRIETESGEVTIPLEGGYFEVEVPADFHAGEYDSFTISWIDFYR